jgi:hypothetical protein
MAKKKAKPSNSTTPKKRLARKRPPFASKAARPGKPARTSLLVPGAVPKLLAETPPLQCPTHLYAGTVRLDANNRRSFLETATGTYLMSLDPDCSGVVNAGRIDAAFGTFSQNPGGNQAMQCNGFLHEDGTAFVLHVVN